MPIRAKKDDYREYGLAVLRKLKKVVKWGEHKSC